MSLMLAILLAVLVVAAASAAGRMDGVSGCEGRIIRVNLVPCFAYCLVAILVLWSLA